MNRQSSIVFTPAQIGPLQIKNRLVRSATGERAATERGEVSDFLVDVYRTLAKGGVGLIITGVVNAYSKSVNNPFIRADDDYFIPGLAKIPRAVREADSDCKVILQLVHWGRQVAEQEKAAKLMPFLPPAFLAYMRKHPEIMATTGQTQHVVLEPTAPSAIYDALFDRTPRALKLEEIDGIIEAFTSAICRAKEAGFDGVQLHAAHGYLLSTFLSPRTNQRQDDYGGSTENRTRIVRDIYERARKKVGDTFPILIKMNTTDFLPGGMDTDEAVKIGKLLSEVGIAAIETSGGMWESVTRPKDELGWLPVLIPEARTGINEREQEAYFLPGAAALKEKTKATVILVGGLRSFTRIEEILTSGAADFVALCRPLIRQPDLPVLWRSGKGPDKAECISCNACFPAGVDRFGCRAKVQ
jgi:2,4-dienoyl-CoA reductase-like NADH-dependent reductase (Old Yellow Enzyme family)